MCLVEVKLVKDSMKLVKSSIVLRIVHKGLFRYEILDRFCFRKLTLHWKLSGDPTRKSKNVLKIKIEIY